MKVHFIAIGGSAMHNLALALHKKGYEVSGSDDEIFEPSKSRLREKGLLPEKEGWFTEKITSSIDAVILGMHARIDNPELLKAKELNLPVYSYPEYLYEQAKNKTRVVIGGSHGKTSITAMILHVLNFYNKKFDYMVGAQLAGFETMTQISEEAEVMIFEGDEYLSSPIDRRPKFHLYKPHIALISGIAWDHINVFPTFEDYVKQFEIFIELIEKNGSLLYFEGDHELKILALNTRKDIKTEAYSTHEHSIKNGKTYLNVEQTEIPIQIFGQHNLQNLVGAMKVLMQLGISQTDYYQAIKSFTGAAKRLEKLAENGQCIVFKDFAHSPSKLKATVQAVKEQFSERQLIACVELHTFSSLNKSFLKEYKNTLQKADIPMVYYNPHTVQMKKLESISVDEIHTAFNSDKLEVYTDSEQMQQKLLALPKSNTVFLLMSSGNFDGINLEDFANKLLLS